MKRTSKPSGMTRDQYMRALTGWHWSHELRRHSDYYFSRHRNFQPRQIGAQTGSGGRG